MGSPKRPNGTQTHISRHGATALALSLMILAGSQMAIAEDMTSYLFAYFIGNGTGQESVRYALSDNGLAYRALNENEPVIDPALATNEEGMRDPHILRGEDGNYYMVATDMCYANSGSWTNYALVLMKSGDLINWTGTSIVIPDVYPAEFGSVYRVWAPQTIYDPVEEKYMVYFSMLDGVTITSDTIFYAYANEDFTGFEAAPEQLYDPEAAGATAGACIDADIIYRDSTYYMYYKSESAGGIRLATSSSLTSGYTVVNSGVAVDNCNNAVEGSCTFPLIGDTEWILMYDVYGSGYYEFTKGTDMVDFTTVETGTTLNFFPRHGTVIQITDAEREALENAYGAVNDFDEITTGSTLAWWRFENGTDSSAFPDTSSATSYVSGTPDVSGNGNELCAYTSSTAIASANTPPTLPGDNSLMMETGDTYPSLFTWSEESSPSGIDLETAALSAWTIEACVYSTSTDTNQTFIGRDGYATKRAPLYFKIYNDSGTMHFRCQYIDRSGVYQILTGSREVSTNNWYYVAAVSDGSTMSLYSADLTAGETEATLDGTPVDLTADSTDTSLAPWPDYSPENDINPMPRQCFSVGRGYYDHGDTDRFYGYIDEVRISSEALDIATESLLATGVPVQLSGFQIQ